MTKQEIEFDTPFRDLGFPGAPFRSTVLLQPTSGCLVNLTEWVSLIYVVNQFESWQYLPNMQVFTHKINYLHPYWTVFVGFIYIHGQSRIQLTTCC